MERSCAPGVNVFQGRQPGDARVPDISNHDRAELASSFRQFEQPFRSSESLGADLALRGPAIVPGGTQMALFEDVLKGGTGTGLLVGLGAVLLAPTVLPTVGRI